MKNHQKQIFTLAVTLVLTATVLFLTGLSEAGKPEKPDPVMDMLQDIYDVVVDTNSKVGVPASVPQTGQTTCYDTDGTEIDCAGTGQDGEYQYGTPWPDPRFTDNLDGTVTDNLTGLIWLKNANCFGIRAWATALNDANVLASGSCDLTDGSAAGDWRLPNVKELQSLIDFGNENPALPSGHPFSNVQVEQYWSSTTRIESSGDAWVVYMGYGHVWDLNMASDYYVWPVRGGN